MRSLRTFGTRHSRGLRARMCLRCGYRGSELQPGRSSAASFVCPSCGQDLYARPARSYAEMEGLETDSPHATKSPRSRRPAPAVGPNWGHRLGMGTLEFCLALGLLVRTVWHTGVLWRVRRAPSGEGRNPTRREPERPVQHTG